MTYPHRPRGTALARPVSHAQSGQWTARRSPYAPAAAPNAPSTLPMRRYQALALLPDGDLAEVTQSAPAHPIFEAAFAAIARGTILATEQGPVAIEDLLPGVKVETRDAGFQPLTWIGSTLVAPNQPFSDFPARLFRVPVDSFGPSRPMPDLMLAPHARLMHRSPKMRELFGYDSAVTPVPAFEDGYSVIRVAPASPVTVYHLAFRKHQVLRANGLEIESFHPGTDLSRNLGGDSLRQFLDFFPHIDTPAGFGPLVAPRLTAAQYEEVMGA